MIQSRREHEAVVSLLSSEGWKIIEEAYAEKAKIYLREALDIEEPTKSKMALNGYKTAKNLAQLPYALLEESNYKEEY